MDNSLISLVNGLNSNQYIGVETDIRITKDNVIVLYHDPLYNGNLVKNTLYKDMKNDNIIRLEDLLKIKTDKILLLEIKDFSMNLDILLKVLKKYKRNIYIMSFNNKVINELYERKVKYKLGVLNYVLNNDNDYKYDFICLINDLLSKDILSKFISRNIEVISYGVRSEKSMKFDNIMYIVNHDIFIEKK